MSPRLTVRCEDGTDLEADEIFVREEGELELVGREDSTTVFTSDIRSIIAGSDRV